ncbi:MAG: hypothetical protein AABZ30_16625, partial [Myxococcota bacterium]
AGLRVTAGGAALGATDASGFLRGAVRGFDGDRVTLALTPPPGLRVAGAAERTATLQVVAPLGGGTPLPQALRLRATLTPLERRYVVLVRTDGRSGLPVRVFDRVLGETDASGVTQLLLRAPPGDEITVSLDTRAQPRLRPANPTRVFRLADRDDAFVFRQDFAEGAPRARRSTATPRGAPRRL